MSIAAAAGVAEIVEAALFQNIAFVKGIGT